MQQNEMDFWPFFMLLLLYLYNLKLSNVVQVR